MQMKVFQFMALRNPQWYRAFMGNPAAWESFGKLQLDYLISQGLEPQHLLLDVACGPLQAGRHFIEYLEKQHFFGIDDRKVLIVAGEKGEIRARRLKNKKPVLRYVEDFDLSWLHASISFDYVLAENLFTRIFPEKIDICLKSVEARLASQGAFYATFNLSPDGKTKKKSHPYQPYEKWIFYPKELFDGLAESNGLSCEYIGKWGYSRNSKNEKMMLRFSKI